MPIVQIDLIEGRTVEQKRKMAQKVTEAIVEATGCPPGAVRIIIRDMPTQHYAEAGVLRYDQTR
ncbi:MAG: 4-oxalocrotonate tautomerase [Firmicutes bacterium]|nr:4-oxalocrotonate tautomerase [Bacillota bacterium]